jgi:hypothetical protein
MVVGESQCKRARILDYGVIVILVLEDILSLFITLLFHLKFIVLIAKKGQSTIH